MFVELKWKPRYDENKEQSYCISIEELLYFGSVENTTQKSLYFHIKLKTGETLIVSQAYELPKNRLDREIDILDNLIRHKEDLLKTAQQSTPYGKSGESQSTRSIQKTIKNIDDKINIQRQVVSKHEVKAQHIELSEQKVVENIHEYLSKLKSDFTKLINGEKLKTNKITDISE